MSVFSGIFFRKNILSFATHSTWERHATLLSDRPWVKALILMWIWIAWAWPTKLPCWRLGISWRFWSKTSMTGWVPSHHFHESMYFQLQNGQFYNVMLVFRALHFLFLKIDGTVPKKGWIDIFPFEKWVFFSWHSFIFRWVYIFSGWDWDSMTPWPCGCHKISAWAESKEDLLRQRPQLMFDGRIQRWKMAMVHFPHIPWCKFLTEKKHRCSKRIS